MTASQITKTIERQRWLDPAAKTVDRALGATLDRSGTRGERAKYILHGDWLGHPLHPALTDIPVGAFTVGVVLDATGAITRSDKLDSGADAAITVGVLSALAAAGAGWTDWHMARDPAIKRTGLVHAALNISAVSMFSASLLQRRRKRRRSGNVLAVLGILLLAAGAYVGGTMVYRQSVGVKST
jgi:uncharacterized membrane protein